MSSSVTQQLKASMVLKDLPMPPFAPKARLAVYKYGEDIFFPCGQFAASLADEAAKDKAKEKQLTVNDVTHGKQDKWHFNVVWVIPIHGAVDIIAETLEITRNDANLMFDKLLGSGKPMEIDSAEPSPSQAELPRKKRERQEEYQPAAALAKTLQGVANDLRAVSTSFGADYRSSQSYKDLVKAAAKEEAKRLREELEPIVHEQLKRELRPKVIEKLTIELRKEMANGEAVSMFSNDELREIAQQRK